MLKAISIAGTSTQAFADFVVGHGELWTAPPALPPSAARASTLSGSTRATCSSLPTPRTVASTSTTNALTRTSIASSTRRATAPRVRTGSSSPGFHRAHPRGVPTTLKRNGSDYSATIFGALLIASNISIWTDVDGVYWPIPAR